MIMAKIEFNENGMLVAIWTALFVCIMCCFVAWQIAKIAAKFYEKEAQIEAINNNCGHVHVPAEMDDTDE